MKAQHRHELHTNELADWLERTFEKLKPYSRAITGVPVAAAIIMGVYAYVNALERRGVAAAADQFISALQTQDPSQFEATVESYRGTKPADLAQLVLAEGLLNTGTSGLYTDKPNARDNLGKAAGGFSAVKDTTRDPMLRAWALYGLGRAHESMNNLDMARDDFQTLIREYPDGALVEPARKHFNQLSQPAIKEFYDWFAKQDPRPPALDREPGIPGLKPSFDLKELGAPGDIKITNPFDSSVPPGGGSTPPSSTEPPAAEKSGTEPPEQSPPASSKATDAQK